MKIALIGYGKMGKAIEEIALSRGHEISYRISQQNQGDLVLLDAANTDIAIEFTQPEAAFANISACLQQKIPVVCGTTGWLAHKTSIDNLCKVQETAFLHASNFSIGVNIFFKINALLAKLIGTQAQYEVRIEEIHHTQKKDAPSGTALVIAQDILAHLPQKSTWTLVENNKEIKAEQLPITALRLPEVAGTHTVSYISTQDTLRITHEAHNRTGFALGAVLAAEWLRDKKGVFTMEDVIGL